MIVCGIDEVGRGPMIGPMILGCILIDEKGKKTLKKLKVKDSKKLTPNRRTELEPHIKECAVEWSLLKIQPVEIDRMRKKISLNAIEALKIADLIIALKTTPDKVIVDAADPIAESFKKRIVCILEERNAFVPDILSEHKADDNYIEVSAASVIAKVERDRDIEALSKKYGELGSGYPHDEVTQAFVRELMKNGKENLPDFVRRSWASVGNAQQSRIGEY